MAHAKKKTNAKDVDYHHILANTDHPPGIVVYTDGACQGNPGPAGVGVVVVYDHAICELSEYLGHGTNNIAELTAVLRAIDMLQAIPEYLVGGDGRAGAMTVRVTVTIHTDSTYAIGVLTKHWQAKANLALIEQIKDKLQQLRTRAKVTFVHVRAHSGVPLNEVVDQLARMAIEHKNNAGWCTKQRS